MLKPDYWGSNRLSAVLVLESLGDLLRFFPGSPADAALVWAFLDVPDLARAIVPAFRKLRREANLAALGADVELPALAHFE